MKFAVVIAVLLAVALAAPLDDPSQATILRFENDNVNIEGYKFAFETSDGTKRDEQGELKNPGSEQEALSVTGSATWVADDGQTYTFSYIADENGFQPEGAHLPQP